MDFLGTGLLQEILTDAAKAELSQRLIVFMIIWFVVRRSIRGHFVSIEEGLKEVAHSVNELSCNMLKLETAHAARLEKLETSMISISNRVENLEETKTGGDHGNN